MSKKECYACKEPNAEKHGEFYFCEVCWSCHIIPAIKAEVNMIRKQKRKKLGRQYYTSRGEDRVKLLKEMQDLGDLL